MYEDLTFAPEKEHVNVKDMTEALDKVKEFETKTVSVSFADTKISLNGGVALVTKDEKRKMTKWSLQSLCKFLGIPDPFARKIPVDLLRENISRLLQEKKEDAINLLIGKENEVVNIVKANYKPFQNREFLLKLDPFFRERNVEWESMRLGYRGFDLNIIDPSIKPLEPKVGDITKIGFGIINSDTGYRDAIAKVYLFRLTCVNGATLTEDWGIIRRDSNRKISLERDFTHFIDKCKNLRIDVNRLNDIYHKMPETNLTDFQVESVWSATNRVAGLEQADAVINKNEDGRKAILHLVSSKRAHNRQLFIDEVKQPEPTDVNAYNTYNRITDDSKRYTWQDALRLQAIGGRIISMLVEQTIVSEN